jgi:hypothetical protein
MIFFLFYLKKFVTNNLIVGELNCAINIVGPLWTNTILTTKFGNSTNFWVIKNLPNFFHRNQIILINLN